MSRAKLALGVPLAMAADQALSAMLRRARPRPFGLSTPAAMPAMLSSAGQSGLNSFTSVALCYGLPLRVAGPLTEVQTCFSDRDRDLSTLQETITRAELRDHAWAREDWEGDPGLFSPFLKCRIPADGFERHERIVIVAGQEHRVWRYPAAAMKRCGLITTRRSLRRWPGLAFWNDRSST